MPSIIKALREVAARGKKLSDDPRIEVRKVRPKAFSSDGKAAGGDYQNSPYDFAEVDNLVDTDSYARQSTARMLELFFKEGYDLKGQDQDAVQFIKMRFRLLGIAMNQAFDDFLAESADNLISYHNVFWIKTRNITPQQITGLPYSGLGGKDPIAGYVIAPVGTMSIMRDEKSGLPKKYKQIAGSNQAEFPLEDVVHFTARRKTGTVWGKPDLLTAVEDIISFRIIEQDALNLVHKEMYPTYVYYVGDDMRPADDEDLTIAAKRLEEMRDVGGLVAPGKDKVEILQNDKTLDVTPHINHFKERGIIGLGVSPYQIGVTSDVNKSIADNLDKALYDKIKNYQRILENSINEQVIFELLLEGGFDPLGISGDSQMVTIEFKEIDVEAQISRENHTSTLWLQDMITHGEMRKAMGMEVDPELAKLYYKDAVTIPVSEATGAMTGPEGGTNPKSPAKGAAGSKDQPSNQNKKRTSPKVKAGAEPSDVDKMLEYTDILERMIRSSKE